VKQHAIVFALCLLVSAWGLLVVTSYAFDPAGVGCCH
jgi:hypothetical protein